MGGVTFRLAVIGSGFMGNVHAKNAFFHPVVELVAVQDIEFERAERLASVARTTAVKDVAEILEDESVSLYQGANIVSDGLHYGWANRLEESYYGALDAFVACGRGLSAPSPSIVDGLRAQFLAEKARESLEHHCPIRF